MLVNSDIGVLIKSARSPDMEIDSFKHIIRTEKPGPEGWQAAMATILQAID